MSDVDILEGKLFFICIVVIRASASSCRWDIGPLTNNGVFFCNQNIGGSLEGGDGDFCILVVTDIIDISYSLCGTTSADFDLCAINAKVYMAIGFTKTIIGLCYDTRIFT